MLGGSVLSVDAEKDFINAKRVKSAEFGIRIGHYIRSEKLTVVCLWDEPMFVAVPYQKWLSYVKEMEGV